MQLKTSTKKGGNMLFFKKFPYNALKVTNYIIYTIIYVYTWLKFGHKSKKNASCSVNILFCQTSAFESQPCSFNGNCYLVNVNVGCTSSLGAASSVGGGGSRAERKIHTLQPL